MMWSGGQQLLGKLLIVTVLKWLVGFKALNMQKLKHSTTKKSHNCINFLKSIYYLSKLIHSHFQERFKPDKTIQNLKQRYNTRNISWLTLTEIMIEDREIHSLVPSVMPAMFNTSIPGNTWVIMQEREEDVSFWPSLFI